MSALKTLLLLPGVYHLIAFVTARRVLVRGESMLPAILPGERVLFDTLAYRLGEPRIGEIVLARHPHRPGRLVIKRVAGVPGQHVSGQQLAGGEYWLLGDSPEFSTDSRELGVFRREDIVGRGWWVYWPVAESRRVS
jgi:nickel-type superoxide dismutase maturation protease